MKKLSAYKKKKISENLEYFYNQATTEQAVEGINWYPKAQDIVRTLAIKYDFETKVVANVLSALSPRNKWKRNIHDTEQVLIAVRYGRPAESIKVCTFTSNKIKAFEFATGKRELIDYETSPKTYSFVENIHALNPKEVTIDVWHTRACFDRMIVPTTLSKSNYEDIKQITLENASKHGLRGYEYQAIIWGVIRE